ncbi:rhomboid family intramembrane serine protease [Tepidibacillus marianensis]|uniref:rhomboid family intramembrane serine protease n=1 Tax=Tepidibacillus marianensis TaxID=3131995 RepID=UPI0030CF23EE
MIEETDLLEYQRRQQLRGIFQDGKPYLTYILIAINVIVYILMEIKGGSTDPRVLLQFGAKESYLISQGEYWRFVTPIFLHIGLIHLALNSVAIYYIGQLTERIYGSFRFLLIYLIAGIVGNAASFMFAPNSIGAGASGAIFGLFGSLLYFGYVYPPLFFRTMGKDVLTVIAINLVFGFSVSSIDNYAHIGGLIGGFFASGFVRLPRQQRKKWGMTAIASIFLIASVATTYWAVQNRDIKGSQALVFKGEDSLKNGDYQAALKVFSHLIESDSTNANYQFYYAYTNDQLGKLDIAKDHYEQALASDPKLYQAHFNIARILVMQHQNAGAIPHLQQALKINPQFTEAKDLLQQIQGNGKAE